MSLPHQPATRSVLLQAGSVSRADTSLDAKIPAAVLDFALLCTTAAPDCEKLCLDEVLKFGARLNTLSLSDRQAIEQAQTAAKKAIDAIYRKAFNGSLDTCLAKLKAYQTEANVQADTQGMILDKDKSIALAGVYDDALKVKSNVAYYKKIIDNQANLGLLLVDSTRKCGNTFNSTNTDGHPGRKILLSGSDCAESGDQAPADAQQEQTPTAEPIVPTNEEVAPTEPNKSETESAPSESEQEPPPNDTDEAEASQPQTQSYDSSIANNKSAINTACAICESKIVQRIHAIVTKLKEEGIPLDLATAKTAKANVTASIEEQALARYQSLINQLLEDPNLKHDTVQFGLVEALVTYINQLSPDGVNQVRGIGIDQLLPKDEELPSNDSKGTRKAGKSKGKRQGGKSQGETLRKPKSFYEAKLIVKHNGEFIQVSVSLPRKLLALPVKALAGLICSQVLGPEFISAEAEISLEYEADTEEHKVKSFDYKVVPSDDSSALAQASDAEPDSGTTDTSGTTDSAINEEQRSPEQLPIGYTPCPGTNISIGAFIASILVFMNYGITFNASSQIMYRRSHGHDNIYKWLKFLNQVFFAPWAEAIRDLISHARQQQHDESSLTVAPQAVEKLGRRHIYFVESRGILLSEFKKLRGVLVACTYAGGRGFNSLMPIIARFIGKTPKEKSVTTDAYKVYDKIFKILGVTKHQVCMAHFMRTFIAALKGVFESMGEVDKDRKLSKQKKIERMQSLIESNSAIFNLCHGLLLLRRIFHIDWDPVFDLPIDELLERNEKMASLRGSETIRELFDLLKACILNLDAAELNDKGMYVGKSGALGATAATFFLNNENKLRTFLDDFFATKTTNDVERVVKRIFLRLKLIDYQFMSLELIETFANFGTIVSTLEANKIDPFTGICEMYDLAYNAGLLGFAYDHMVVRYIHDGEQTMCTQLRDVKLDDPDTGFQNWAEEATLYMVDHLGMKGYKEELMPQLYDKLTYPKRLAAMEAAKDAKKEQSTDTITQTSKNNVPASAKAEAA